MHLNHDYLSFQELHFIFFVTARIAYKAESSVVILHTLLVRPAFEFLTYTQVNCMWMDFQIDSQHILN